MVEVFFQSIADRDLWLRLNAEQQIIWEKNLTYYDSRTESYRPTMQALNPRTMEEALEVARNQLNYDIKNNKLRFTLEEYLLLSPDELLERESERNRELIELIKNA